jgi:hypothetical protein
VDSRFTWFYLVAFVVVLVVELIGVHRKQKGDTITEHVRLLMRKKVVYFTFAGFWVWLTVHFFTGWV